MQRFSWLHKRIAGGSQTRRAPARKPTTRFRPQPELLERREVLSTLTVTSNLDSGTGSLRAEIAAAQSGDTIVFDPSLDGQTITLGSGSSDGGVGIQWSQLEINQNLTIQGPGAGLLAISGGGFYGFGSRVFKVDAGANVTISGLTIEGGDGDAYYSTNSNNTGDYYDGHGGGILNLGTLTLSGCNVTGNNTGFQVGYGVSLFEGGGICNDGTLTLSSSTVSDNYPLPGHFCNEGGGIYNDGTMTLSSSTATGNSAIYGGGICNDGTSTLSSSTVTSNSATDGGGIYNDGTLTLSSSTVTSNSATDGGGIYNDTQGHLTILSSVVRKNTGKKGTDIYNLGWMQISKDSQVGHVFNK